MENLILGAALAFAQTLPPGVYISMNGRYFSWDNVRKNRQTGKFSVIDRSASGGEEKN
jgi:L-asparaginase